MAEHLVDDQPRNPDPGMDSLIRHLESNPEATPQDIEKAAGEQQDAQQKAPAEDPFRFGGPKGTDEAEAQPTESQPIVEDDELDPLVPVKVNGVEEEVRLSEMQRGYSRQQDYTRKTQALSEERKAIEAERSQLMLSQRQAVERAAGLAQQLEHQLSATGPDAKEMAHLRATNPGEWSARMKEHDQRQSLIAAANQEAQGLAMQQNAQRADWEIAKLKEVSPEFAEDFEGTYQRLGRWITDPNGGGLPLEQWNGEYDHRRILMAFDSMKAREKDASARTHATQVKAKVASLPQVRSGPRIEAGDNERERYATSINDMQRLDSVRSIARALQAREDLMKVTQRD